MHIICSYCHLFCKKPQSFIFLSFFALFSHAWTRLLSQFNYNGHTCLITDVLGRKLSPRCDSKMISGHDKGIKIIVNTMQTNDVTWYIQP